MWYTRKGDNGTTKLFDCPQGTRLSKSSPVFEALGTLDELNCALGYAKALSYRGNNSLLIDGEKVSYPQMLERLQNILFMIQAELGGSDMHALIEHVEYQEKIVAEVESVLPPVTSFIIPGGTELGAYLDVCRTISRRAERLVVGVHEREERKVALPSLQFLNRFSSVLYALARHVNYAGGISERGPKYH